MTKILGKAEQLLSPRETYTNIFTAVIYALVKYPCSGQLMGNNLGVVWAEFSTLNIAILLVLMFCNAHLRTHIYSKMMFLGSNQVYYWRFKSNTHNNYN